MSLPKNWAVKITEDNREILEKWRRIQLEKDKEEFNPLITCFSSSAKWLFSFSYDGTYILYSDKMYLKAEIITFDDFKKYIVETSNLMKEFWAKNHD